MSVSSTSHIVDFVQTGTSVPFCQGSFIAPFVILTAAQCLMRVDLRDLTLTYGNRQTLKVSLFDVAVPHESYRRRVHRHDIGLLILAARPQGLFTVAETVQSRRDAPGLTTAYGWGLLQYGVEREFLGMPRNIPKNATETVGILDELRCAHDYADVTRTKCRGYPGGPLMCGLREQKLCGINMFEYGSGHEKQRPAAYTEYMFYSAWIQDKLTCACTNGNCTALTPIHPNTLISCVKKKSTADPMLENVVKHTFNVGYISGSPDGVRVSHILGINGKFPGPTIHALPGDIVEVTVNNRISDNQTTSIHWHGIPQATTPFEDGPAYVSQCPIVAGSSQVYRFPIQHPGTYWYHSHVGSQYTEGMWGFIIVHNLREEYYFDAEMHIALQEWYHNSAHKNDAWYLSAASQGAPPFPNSGLMNGVGRFDCNQTTLLCNTRDQRIPVFSLRRSEVNKIRVANVGGYSTYNFTIEGHRLKVMEADGVESNNQTVANGVYLGAGQRYSLILEHSGGTEKSEYFILANIRTEFMFNPPNYTNINQNPGSIIKTIVGRIRYVPASKVLGPSMRVTHNVSGGKNVTEVVPTFMTFPYTTRVPSIPKGTSYLGSSAVRARHTMKPPSKADVTHVLNLDFVDMPDGIRRATFNQIPFIMPPDSKPLLMRMLDDEIFPLTTPSIELEYGRVIDIVFNNLRQGPHPIHLHGHHFWPVYSGPGLYNASAKQKRPSAPIKRDTVMVKEGSYVVIRLVADNPGVWPLHCHIDWHQLSGMRIAIKEAADVARMLLSVPDKHARLCRENGVMNVRAAPAANTWSTPVTAPSSKNTSSPVDNPAFPSLESQGAVEVAPFECGGVIENGVLQFEAPRRLPYRYTCMWTLRLGFFENMNVLLLEENFASSKSKIRLIPMRSMLFNSYNGSSSSLDQIEWRDVGSRGTNHTFSMAVVFVEFVMQGGTSSRPKFHLSFSGSGGRSRWNALTFGSFHFAELQGTIDHSTQRIYSVQSFVIQPHLPPSRKVALIQGFVNLNSKACGHSLCGFLRIWSIGSQSLLGREDNDYRITGHAPNFNSTTDDVGWIIVYDSNHETTGNFSILYQTT